jgi:prevent-host-death family protein
MTEFRNRPGEILDRVADEGETFIIERNGKRKACLVPISFFLPDISPSKIADELSELIHKGTNPRISFTKDHEIEFRFAYEFTDGKSVQLFIRLPHGYPNQCPRAYAKLPTKDVPHRWKDGALCLYGVTTAWNPGKHTVLSTLQLAHQWLRHYETWQNTGTWPREESLNGE